VKIPKARKLPSGKWYIQLRLNGESIYVTGSTETECIHEAQLIKAEHVAGRRAELRKEAKDLTLKEAQERYLAAHKAVLSPATVRSYDAYINHRWTGYRDKALAKIQWQQMINDELAVPVSAKTLKNAWGLVSASLKDVGYPVPEVKLAQVPVKDLDYLRPEEIMPFCDAVKGKSYEIPALLLLHGMRLSEVLGLTWDRVKLNKDKTGSMTISGAVVRGPDGLERKATNKNKSSSRTVPVLIPQLYEALAASQQKEGPVVGIHPSNLLDDVKRACKRANVTVCGCHDLRRSFLSLCYHLNISERQTMQWAGYSDIRTMHATYIKLSEADSSRDAETVRTFFQNATQNATPAEEAPEIGPHA